VGARGRRGQSKGVTRERTATTESEWARTTTGLASAEERVVGIEEEVALAAASRRRRWRRWHRVEPSTLRFDPSNQVGLVDLYRSPIQ
jgi:hypothetical protein